MHIYICVFRLSLVQLPCPHCTSTFSGMSNLKRHTKKYHEYVDIFVCNVCLARFGLQCHLRNHVKVRSESLHPVFGSFLPVCRHGSVSFFALIGCLEGNTPLTFLSLVALKATRRLRFCHWLVISWASVGQQTMLVRSSDHLRSVIIGWGSCGVCGSRGNDGRVITSQVTYVVVVWCRPYPVHEHAQDLRPPLGARPASPPHIKQHSHPHGVRPQIPDR